MSLPVFEFQLAIEPVAKERPRFNRKTGSAYTPTRTVQYEREFAKALKATGVVPREESEDLEIHLQFGVTGQKRKDIDNLAKACLDSGNSVLFADDKQVTSLRASVQYDVEEPFVSLQLYSLGTRTPSNARSRPRKKAPPARQLPTGYDLCPRCQKVAKRVSVALCRTCND